MDSATLGGTIRKIVRDAQTPVIYEARVVRVRKGQLEVIIRGLMGDLRPLPARGAQSMVIDSGNGLELQDPEQGDPVWVALDEGSQLVVVTWEHAGRRARVVAANTAHRRTGLALMFRVWWAAASYYGRTGHLMPRVHFAGLDEPFVGWTVDPPGDLSAILRTGEVMWPDWVNEPFIGNGPVDDGMPDIDVARMLLIHEWAHAFQRPDLTIVEAEGGAQAFTRRFAPEIYAALGQTYENPAYGVDQYTTLDDGTDSGNAHGATGWVEDHRSEEWIVEGQFR